MVLYDKVNQKYFGYAHIDYEENYWFGIYIDDAYQNKKLGSLLMNIILKHKSLNDINKIHLTVDKDNKHAIKVYEKYGFKIVQEKETFYKMEL